jgi:hypothetical protein
MALSLQESILLQKYFADKPVKRAYLFELARKKRKEPGNQSINELFVLFESDHCRDDKISCADLGCPPSYPRSPVPTSSGPFCPFIRFGEQVLHATETTKPAAIAAGFLFVGTTRFELATPCTPCKCATGLRYVPKFGGVQR